MPPSSPSRAALACGLLCAASAFLSPLPAGPRRPRTALAAAAGSSADRPRVLWATDLTVSLGPTKPLDAVAFSLRRGERCGLMGTNGAGKSTLLRVLAGAVLPDDGGRYVLAAAPLPRPQAHPTP